MKRAALLSGSAAVGLGALLPQPAHAQTKDLKPVTLVLEWTGFQPQHFGFWLAKSRGWYAAEGFDVSIKSSSGSAQAVQITSAGRAEFGNVASSALAEMAGTNLTPLRMVATFAQHDSLSIAYFESSGIKKPKDLEGRKIGIVPGSLADILWPSFAQATGIDPTKVELVSWDFRSYYGIFGAKKVDAAANFTIGSTGEYVFKSKGETVHQFVLSDYLPLLGSGVVAHTDLLKSDPDMVKRFVRATQRGWALLEQQPKVAVPEAAAIIHAEFSETPAPDIIAQYAYELIPARMFPPLGKGKPVGWTSPDDWKKMIDLLAKSEKTMTRKLGPSDVMTNDFLSTTYLTRT